MGLRFTIQPVATYTAVSNTNGGGGDFTGSYLPAGLSYLNFHDGDGGPVQSDTVATVSYAGTGAYNFTPVASMASVYGGIIAYCVFSDNSAGTTYTFRAIYDYSGSLHRLTYLPTGDSSDADQTTLDTAIAAWEAGLDSITIYYGGSLLSVATGLDLLVADQQLLIETGTYTISSQITKDLSDMAVRAVNSSGVVDGSQATLQATASMTYMFRLSLATNWSMSDLLFDANSYASYCVRYDDNQLAAFAWNCEYKNAVTSGIFSDSDSEYPLHFNCEMHDCTGWAVEFGSSGDTGGSYYNCKIYSCGNGIRIGAGIQSVIDCLFYNITGDCLYIEDNRFDIKILNNTAYNSGTFLKVESTGMNRVSIVNNILAELTNDITGVEYLERSAYGNNAIYNVTNEATWNEYMYESSPNIALSEDPFIDSASGDFRLNSEGGDFADLYDSNKSRVLCGPFGPELTEDSSYQTGIDTGPID